VHSATREREGDILGGDDSGAESAIQRPDGAGSRGLAPRFIRARAREISSLLIVESKRRWSDVTDSMSANLLHQKHRFAIASA